MASGAVEDVSAAMMSALLRKFPSTQKMKAKLAQVRETVMLAVAST